MKVNVIGYNNHSRDHDRVGCIVCISCPPLNNNQQKECDMNVFA